MLNEMTDIYTKKKRSEIMRKIGPKNSKQELFIRKLVSSLGYKFCLHVNDLPGKPDIVFPRHKRVIFINGCFWHGHSRCTRAKLPKTNRKFWASKIAGNMRNDRKIYRKLKVLGWKYLILWQCDIKMSTNNRLKDRIKRLLTRNKHNGGTRDRTQINEK